MEKTYKPLVAGILNGTNWEIEIVTENEDVLAGTKLMACEILCRKVQVLADEVFGLLIFDRERSLSSYKYRKDNK